MAGSKDFASPLRVQKFIDNSFGAMGQYFYKTSDLFIDSFASKFGFNPNKIRKGEGMEDLLSLSGLNSYIHDLYTPSLEQSVTRFNDIYRRLNGTYRYLQNYKKYYPEQYQEQAIRYWEEYNAYNVLKPYHEAIRNYILMYRAIEKRDDIPDDVKQKQLDLIKGRIRIVAQYGYEVYNTYLKGREKQPNK